MLHVQFVFLLIRPISLEVIFIVVVQNNGKGKTKKRAARATLFFAN